MLKVFDAQGLACKETGGRGARHTRHKKDGRHNAALRGALRTEQHPHFASPGPSLGGSIRKLQFCRRREHLHQYPRQAIAYGGCFGDGAGQVAGRDQNIGRWARDKTGEHRQDDRRWEEQRVRDSIASRVNLSIQGLRTNSSLDVSKTQLISTHELRCVCRRACGGPQPCTHNLQHPGAREKPTPGGGQCARPGSRR